jgi:hypothetical protein
MFVPGDRIAFARGATCHGSFTPHGSGIPAHPIRVTAFGKGPRPRIIAATHDRQVLFLFNQEYWQIDSLDLSGANTYGVFVSGDKSTLHHIFLKNLYVHDIQGAALKNKDNGLVVVGPSSADVVFEDILIDGIDAAHTNQWAGILVGGGNYAYRDDAPLNRRIIVRNSTVHDVYGDGIILFRDRDAAIQTSAAWQTGMQPTQDIGTPNAIWTWTCTDCTVEDNEAFLTDSPGVDGGAYDIDWDNTRNIVQRNYAHDTQGYCVAVFAAGYKTAESLIRDNLCIDNGLSPRLSVLQGAIYLHTWNDGPIRGLQIEDNTIQWRPPVPDAAAFVNDALIQGGPAVFRHNRIESSSRWIYRSNAQLLLSENTYSAGGEPLFTLGDVHDVSLPALQAAGKESGSILVRTSATGIKEGSLLIDAFLRSRFDADGLLAPELRAQLIVLRDLAGQYGPDALAVTVHLQNAEQNDILANALGDLNDVYRGILHFECESDQTEPDGTILVKSSDGERVREWHGFQNAAILGGAVRALLGAPRYAYMPPLDIPEKSK